MDRAFNTPLQLNWQHSLSVTNPGYRGSLWDYSRLLRTPGWGCLCGIVHVGASRITRGLIDEQLRFSINRASLDKSEPLSSELFAIRKSMEGQQKDSGMQPVWIREETETVFKRAV